MTNTPHPLDQLDRETLARTLTTLSQAADAAMVSWHTQEIRPTLTHLGTVQDVLNRAADIIATIESRENCDPADPNDLTGKD